MATMNDKQKRRINGLLELIGSVPEGKMLVDAALKSGVEIFFDPELKKKYEEVLWTGGSSVRGYYNTDGYIGLNEALRNNTLTRTLTHELSHLYQFLHFDHNLECRLSPRERTIYSRILEGDADARSARIIKAINRHWLMDILPCDRAGARVLNWLVGKFCRAARLSERVFRQYQKAEISAYYDVWEWDSITQQSPPSSRVSLSDVFNKCAGVFKNGATLYMGAKDIPDLIEKVGKYAPATQADIEKYRARYNLKSAAP